MRLLHTLLPGCLFEKARPRVARLHGRGLRLARGARFMPECARLRLAGAWCALTISICPYRVLASASCTVYTHLGSCLHFQCGFWRSYVVVERMNGLSPTQASIDEAYADISRVAAAELAKLQAGGQEGAAAAMRQVGGRAGTRLARRSPLVDSALACNISNTGVPTSDFSIPSDHARLIYLTHRHDCTPMFAGC
jgi:hypothetical protein